MSTHVLDTCAVLDLAADRWTIATAREELVDSRDPVVLSVTVWEIAWKLRIGELKLPCAQDRVLRFVLEVCERYRLRLVPLTAEICEQAELLPAQLDDPIDRMILALAAADSAPVFTMDPRFRKCDVDVLHYR
jgi:PIN domain nuclease of toxin-antitoxin system